MENVKSYISSWFLFMIAVSVILSPAIFPEVFLIISVFLHPYCYIMAVLYPPASLESIPNFEIGPMILVFGGLGLLVGLYRRTIILSMLAMLIFWIPLIGLTSFEYHMNPHITITSIK